MSFVFSIKFPEGRLQLIFEVWSLWVFQDDIVVETERLVLSDNWHLGLSVE